MKNFISTRNGQAPLGFHQAIAQGIASDGGLLVPDFELPHLDIRNMTGMDYVSVAGEILAAFAPEEDRETLVGICRKAYGSGLFPEDAAPLRKVGDVWVTELTHGRTCAFKDMALSVLPHLMRLALDRSGEDRKVMILAATSGDTGKAALEGFRDVPGTAITVFYPSEGVSAVQKLQMVTQEGGNVSVVGIDGNFDDAQRAVKQAFSDPGIAEECRRNGVFLSSANSINIGRLLPQIAYYFWSYLSMVRNGAINMGAKIDFCVPSGNFGNCLAGWMAREMGVPARRFIVASNPNDILTDFFNTGVYDARREFFKTCAPAMDILVSNNMERLLWYMTDKDGDRVRALMEGLRKDGYYKVEGDVLDRIRERFRAGFLSEEEIKETIGKCYREHSYLLDTHTACGYGVLERLRREEGDSVPTVLMSTASPFKFPEAVLEAICGEKLESAGAISRLEQVTGIKAPLPLKGLENRKVLHNRKIDRTEMAGFISASVRNK